VRLDEFLGAQIVGTQGVDKRIDVVATAIFSGLTVEDLEGLDLAYAPPYSSAKDPVILAGYIAANEHRGELRVTTAAEVARRLDAGEKVRLLDVRTPGEYLTGHMPGARLVPLDSLRGRLARSSGTVESRSTAEWGIGRTTPARFCTLWLRGGEPERRLHKLGAAYPERVDKGQGPT